MERTRKIDQNAFRGLRKSAIITHILRTTRKKDLHVRFYMSIKVLKYVWIVPYVTRFILIAFKLDYNTSRVIILNIELFYIFGAL